MSKLGAAGLACVLALTVGLASGVARAQTPALARSDSAAAAASAAMERVQRLAANPMRVILEASRFKRKVSADDVTVETADAASLRRTAARSSAGAEPAPAAARPAVDAVATAAAPVPPRVAPTEPLMAISSSSLSAPAPAPDALPALEPVGARQLLTDVAPLPSPSPALATLAAAMPRLIEAVDPVFSGRAIDEAALLKEVLAELTLRPDGTVAQAVLPGAVPRALQRPIVAALEQWRFAPLPAQQLHRVQLVFGTK